MTRHFEIRSTVTLLSKGQKIFGMLHLPEDRKSEKVPVVFFCHGFGGNKSGKYRLSVRQSEQLARAGVASLRIDFRGAGDSEGDFADCTVGSQLDDARLAIEFLYEHPAIDFSRLGLLGRSLGGAIATQLASEVKTVKSLALWCPVFDAKPWQAHSEFMGQMLTDECISQFSRLDSQAPLAKLTHLPLLIIQGSKDEILGRYHYEKYLDCRKSSLVTESLELTESNHEFGHVPEQTRLLEKTTEWFQNTL